MRTNFEGLMLSFACVACACGLGAGFVFLVWRAGKRDAWRRWMQPGPSCPGCGYDLRGLTTACCPECGNKFTLGDLWLAQRDLSDEFVKPD